MSIESQALQQTQAFLSLLASCQADSLDSDLLGGLQHALSSDGFIIQHSQGLAHRYLRGLAESSGGDIDFVSLVMVAVCVICAGFASGLTQVSITICTTVARCVVFLIYLFFVGLVVAGLDGDGNQSPQWNR